MDATQLFDGSLIILDGDLHAFELEGDSISPNCFTYSSLEHDIVEITSKGQYPSLNV